MGIGIFVLILQDPVITDTTALGVSERQAAVAAGWGESLNSLQWSAGVASVLFIVAVVVSALRAPRARQVGRAGSIS